MEDKSDFSGKWVVGFESEVYGRSSNTKIDCPSSPGRRIDVPFSETIPYFNIFPSGSYSGL
jgi:hypothetical protein